MARTIRSYLTSAVSQLTRACEMLLDRADHGEDISAKEIRDLMVTLKELAGLRDSLDEKPSAAVRVIFDGEAGEWSK